MLKDAIRNLPKIRRFLRRAKFSLSKDSAIGHERELTLLPFIVPRNRTALDVGANVGIYTEALVRLCDHVIAIEPNPLFAHDLSTMFKEVQVLPIAASDSAGKVTLRVPRNAFFSGMATIEPDNPLLDQAVDTFLVDKATIDSLSLSDVGFIKIDVEGHESATLEGAIQTIKTSRPNLLIEAEERHRAGSVKSTIRFLSEIGYSGFMLWNGTLTPISRFDSTIHQSTPPQLGEARAHAEHYVNNFLFLPN
jgi:FkbM family methyltransferase